MEKFIREEYRNAATVLPIEARTYGRATKGAALAMLMRFELNKKNWQTVVDLSKEIMDLGAYSIFQSDNRADLFKIENEVNSEFIWARNYIAATEIGMIYLPRSAPRYQITSIYFRLKRILRQIIKYTVIFITVLNPMISVERVY